MVQRAHAVNTSVDLGILAFSARHAEQGIDFRQELGERSAAAQHGASVSLTHTVIVTVPPRVKVQVGNAQVVPNALRVSGQASANGLSLSIAATQPWTLSIGRSAWPRTRP